MSDKGNVFPFEQPTKQTRTWLAVAFEQPHRGLDISQPQTIKTAVRAMRSDGFQVRVEGAIFLDRVKVLPMAEDIVNVTIMAMRDLLDKIEGYRDCSCRNDKPCKEHMPQRVN